MSDYKPITGELRAAMCQWGWDAEQTLAISGSDFDRLCDAIDAVHAQLERENAALKAELDRVRGKQEEHAHTMGESIANELREYAEDWDWLDTGAERAQDRIEAIADRIDAEHEAMIVDARKTVYQGYIELPKDVDDEYIHEHDNADWRDHAGTWHENATVVALCNDGCYVMDGIVFHVHKSDIRHHHAPTVEDVLREFALKVAGEECMTMRTGVVEEYATKLRLVNDEE